GDRPCRGALAGDLHPLGAARSGACDVVFFFSSRRRHTSSKRDWSSDVCSSDLCASALLRVGATLLNNVTQAAYWHNYYYWLLPQLLACPYLPLTPASSTPPLGHRASAS